MLQSNRRELFARSLIEQLLTYATGRHMEETDRFEIDDILARLQADGGGLRSMVIEVLTSETFRSR